jgi:hypothetical protein
VRIGSSAGATTPLSCSVSQAADGSCPLSCALSSGGDDVNQGNGLDTWFLGPPGSVSNSTYNTFAVTRTDPTQEGGCSSGVGNFK